MFNKKRKLVIDSISSVLGETTRLDGKLTFGGTMRIDGNVEGHVLSNDKEGGNNTLIIGEKAKINGDIHVDTLINSGKINGNICATNRVALHEPGQVNGDIETAEITIEEGVVFNGNCSMLR